MICKYIYIERLITFCIFINLHLINTEGAQNNIIYQVVGSDRFKPLYHVTYYNKNVFGTPRPTATTLNGGRETTELRKNALLALNSSKQV